MRAYCAIQPMEVLPRSHSVVFTNRGLANLRQPCSKKERTKQQRKDRAKQQSKIFKNSAAQIKHSQNERASVLSMLCKVGAAGDQQLAESSNSQVCTQRVSPLSHVFVQRAGGGLLLHQTAVDHRPVCVCVPAAAAPFPARPINLCAFVYSE